MSYIATCVRRAGWLDQRETEERSHDIASQLLLSTLFRGFNQSTSGPMPLRFRRSVANAIINQLQKEQTRRRLLSTVQIGDEPEPGRSSGTRDDGDKIIKDFRKLVHKRLGGFGVAILDARLTGEDMKGLAQSPSLGSPGKNRVKAVVCRIKELAQEYAVMRGDSEMLRGVEKAMAAESETVVKRRATVAARRAAVA